MMKLTTLAALLLPLLTSLPALAQDEAEVRAYLLSVNQLYQELEYESALKQIARARAVTHSPSGNATLSLYEGVILADMNRKQESNAAFKQALLVQPDAQLPVKVSPKVAQQFEQIRKSVKQELASRPKVPEPPPLPPPTPGKPVKPPEPEPQRAQLAPPPPQPTPAVATRGLSRPGFLIPAITGGALMVFGGTSWALSRHELSRLNNDDPGLVTANDVRQAASRGRTFQSVGLALVGTGAAALGFALGGYVLGDSRSELALSVGTQGSSAFVQGRWP